MTTKPRVTSALTEYLNEVRAREQAAAEGPWGLYRDPANPDVPKLLKMLEKALPALRECCFCDEIDAGLCPSCATIHDIEQIARGELK